MSTLPRKRGSTVALEAVTTARPYTGGDREMIKEVCLLAADRRAAAGRRSLYEYSSGVMREPNPRVGVGRVLAVRRCSLGAPTAPPSPASRALRLPSESRDGGGV